MRYKIVMTDYMGDVLRGVVVDRGNEEFTAFDATVENPVYDSFLESQSLTDAEVQAMTPDVWHDMA